MNDARKEPGTVPVIRHDSAAYAEQTDSSERGRLGGARIEQVAQRYRIPLPEEPGVIEALGELDAGTVASEVFAVIADLIDFVHALDGKAAPPPGRE